MEVNATWFFLSCGYNITGYVLMIYAEELNLAIEASLLQNFPNPFLLISKK